MSKKDLLREAERQAGSRDARITRMNALSRAVEYAHMIHLQTGRVPDIAEITQYAHQFLQFIYEPTMRKIEEDLKAEAEKEARTVPPPPLKVADADLPF